MTLVGNQKRNVQKPTTLTHYIVIHSWSCVLLWNVQGSPACFAGVFSFAFIHINSTSKFTWAAEYHNYQKYIFLLY